MYETKSLTPAEVDILHDDGTLASMWAGSKPYIEQGSLTFPFLSEEEKSSATDENYANYVFHQTYGYAVQEHRHVSATYIDDYLVAIGLLEIMDTNKPEEIHLCQSFIRKDKEGTRAFMRDPEYHNSRATHWKSLGCTKAFSYLELTSPIIHSFEAYKNHFAPWPDMKMDWSSLQYLGEVTIDYGEYENTFKKYSMDLK